MKPILQHYHGKEIVTLSTQDRYERDMSAIFEEISPAEQAVWIPVATPIKKRGVMIILEIMYSTFRAEVRYSPDVEGGSYFYHPLPTGEFHEGKVVKVLPIEPDHPLGKRIKEFDFRYIIYTKRNRGPAIKDYWIVGYNKTDITEI